MSCGCDLIREMPARMMQNTESLKSQVSSLRMSLETFKRYWPSEEDACVA
jgi:hypothetical protein